MGDRFPSVRQLNQMTDAAFAASARILFEGGAGFLAHLAAERPFATDAELLAAASRVAGRLPEPLARELADAHPRIGADPGSVSPLSHREQGYGDPPAADREIADRLARLNDAYESRFGFRYVIFVAGRPRDAIVPLLEAALGADPATELRRATDDCVAIAADRLRRLRAGDPR